MKLQAEWEKKKRKEERDRRREDRQDRREKRKEKEEDKEKWCEEAALEDGLPIRSPEVGVDSRNPLDVDYHDEVPSGTWRGWVGTGHPRAAPFMGRYRPYADGGGALFPREVATRSESPPGDRSREIDGRSDDPSQRGL